MGKKYDTIQPIKYLNKTDKNTIAFYIDKLTSPRFLEYTQAARKLIKIGPKAIPLLYNSINLVRESNDTVIPVCLLIIRIIFQKQDIKWVRQQLKGKYKTLAFEELKRRKEQDK